MRYVRFFPLLFLLLDACVDPLPVFISDTESKMVVDGLITQEPGPYTVRLSYSLIVDKNTQKIKYETGAQVWIMDDAGTSELLTETQTGTYSTAAAGIRGEIGRSYSIKIITSKGKEYHSEPQLLTAPGTIEDVYFEFEEDAVGGVNPGETIDAFNLYVDGKGDTEEANFFRWRWTGVAEVKSYPELRDSLYRGERDPRPAPAICSGYIIGPRGLEQVAPCTCCICYSYEYNGAAIVSDNRYSNETEFKKVLLNKIAITPSHFYTRYHTTVEQLSVSEEAYTFWRLVQAQQEATGSIFQPNSIRARGNIIADANSEEVVLGFFGVSGITRQTIFINRSDVPYEVPPIGIIGEDCRKVFGNATTTKPPFW